MSRNGVLLEPAKSCILGHIEVLVLTFFLETPECSNYIDFIAQRTVEDPLYVKGNTVSSAFAPEGGQTIAN